MPLNANAVAAIKGLVDTRTYQAGLDYQYRGMVLVSQVEAGSDILHARVAGSGRAKYNLEVGLKALNGPKPTLLGHCSCPVGYNCKHVVAAVLDHVLATPQTVDNNPTAPDFDLPPEARQWLDDLTRLGRPEEYPPSITQRVVYILKPSVARGGINQLCIDINSVRINKSGEYSRRLERINFDRSIRGIKPGYILDIDIDLYTELNKLSGKYSYAYVGHGLAVENLAMLQRLIDTGRLFWKEMGGPVLRLGEPRPGRIEWQLSELDRKLHPQLLVDEALAFTGSPMLFVDSKNAEVGALDLPMTPQQASAFLRAPPIIPEHAAALEAAIRQSLPVAAHFSPKPQLPAIETDEKPGRLLRLTTTKIREGYTYGRQDFTVKIALIELGFRYGGRTHTLFSLSSDKGEFVESVKGARVIRARRHLDVEASLVKAIDEVGAIEARDIYPELSRSFDHHWTFVDELDWLQFLDLDLPVLQAEGVEIEIDDDFPYYVGKVTRDLQFDFNESSGIDWLELDVGIEVDGEKVDLAPMIADFIKNPELDIEDLKGLAEIDEPLYFRNKAGRYFSVALKRLLPLIISLHELRLGAFSLTGAGTLKMHRASRAFLDLGEATGPNAEALSSIRLAYRSLSAPQDLLNLPLPPSFTAELRPYQATGLAWLNALRETHLGGILADDMGLGKTVQVLAFLSREKAEGRLTRPCLIVVPTSLLANWAGEAKKFAPDLKLILLHGKDRQERMSEVGENDVVITTYPLITRDADWLEEQSWYALILDEAQAIKNPNAVTTRGIMRLSAEHRFCMSGTPMENHLGELWSLMNFVNPGFLGDKTSFAREFRTPIERHQNEEIRGLLAKRVKPFLLRRTKADVASELPPKSEIIERIPLEGKQRDLYDTIRLSLHQKVRQAIAERGLAKSHIIILDALLKLRQTCCDPSLLKINGTKDAPSAKLERLMEMISALTEEGRRIIVFSQFTSMLDIIAARLTAAGVPFGMLTGKSTNRKSLVDSFQSGDAPVFLISLKAGGTGLNLTAADTVILYDPWWNPAVEAQAIDRAYRIGQDKPVFVYRLCAEGTIEDKMEDMKARKQGLADALFDETKEMQAALSDEDIETLFS